MRRRGTAVAIIPVRVHSKRLPGKALLTDSGQPLFLHTWERAVEAGRFDEVYVATDSDKVDDAAQAAGAAVLRTSEHCRTGSERCAEAAASIGAEIIVNIQGDWPEVDPGDLCRLTEAIETGSPTATLATPLHDHDRFRDPDVVKVVRGLNEMALYFSRATIPYPCAGQSTPLRHIGVYAFTRKVLLSIPDLPSSGLAETESLEQLRFLENGIFMRVLETANEPWGIENERDYHAFLQRLANREAPRP